MSSVLLVTATRLLVPLLLVFSVFLLWRGHHEPGGGFVGGLVAATAFVLVALAEDVAAARRVLRVAPAQLLASGLAVAVVSGLAGLAVGRPFLTGLWAKGEDGAGLALGTPLLFDVGVYLTVLGVVTSTLLSLMEDAK
jgi:multisubunit Na+/H+ antiporter MnhB subunit